MTYIPNAGGSPSTTNLRGTFASRPAAGSLGRLYYCTDSLLVFFDTGSTWVPHGPISPLTQTPAVSGFTQYNAGGRATTLSDSVGGIFMGMTNGTTGYDCRVAVQTIASAPYTFTARIFPNQFADTQLFGLALRQSSNGSIETFDMASSATLTSVGFQFHNATANNTGTSPTYTQNATGAIGINVAFMMCNGLWMQVQDDNTNRLYRTATDGFNWITLRSVSRTNFITPTDIGLHLFNSNSGNATQSMFVGSLG